MRRALVAALAAGALALGCGPDGPAPDALRVTTAPAGGDTRLTLIAPPGVKLNARVKPALELRDGTVLRFDSPHLTPDSAYFTRPPTVLLAGPSRRVKGTLRASVCRPDELVCRSVTQEI